jgi:Uma2 family endonuclease
MPAERVYVPSVPLTVTTADELLRMHIPDKRTELVRGVLRVREPAGDRHGRVTMNLTIRLGTHVEREGKGQLFAAETGFMLFRGPDTVRAADIAFIGRARLPETTAGFLQVAPELVVEVLSPSDRPGQPLAKVGDWLEAGAALVWVIDPERRLARIYRADGTESLLEPDGSLDGEGVLPGFTCELASIL